MSKSKVSGLHFTMMNGQVMYKCFCQEFGSANRKLFDRIRYLDVNEMMREHHLVCFTGEHRLVGDLALEQCPYDVDLIWLKHASVDEKFRRIGIAAHLVDLCVKHLNSSKKKLEVSSYSEMGTLYLAPIIQKAISANPDVDIIEKHLGEDGRSFGLSSF